MINNKGESMMNTLPNLSVIELEMGLEPTTY